MNEQKRAASLYRSVAYRVRVRGKRGGGEKGRAGEGGMEVACRDLTFN